jgi:hypothetical protein
MKVRKWRVICAGLVVLAQGGCVSTSDIVPLGKDSFMLNSTSRGGLFAGKEKIDGAKAANAYCEAAGKHMIVRRIDTNGVAGISPVTASFVFSCVSSDDPEYQRPNLRRDPTTIIQDQRSGQ